MENKNYTIIQDINSVKPCSIDSIVTDVRNEIEFALDKSNWANAYRVIKPGAYMLIISGNKFNHRIACAIEDVGFEIKDSLMWLYCSDNSELQPDFSNIIMAKKPTDLSILDNIELYDVGGINIDACRIESENRTMPVNSKDIKQDDSIFTELHKNIQRERVPTNVGRFPANIILTYNDKDKDYMCKGFPITTSNGGSGESSMKNTFANTYNGGWGHDKQASHLGGLGDSGSAARYFYCASRSKKDGDYNTPVSLLQYLVKMISPVGATVLDLCMGSGDIGKAVLYENKENNSNYKYIAIEKSDVMITSATNIFDYINNLKSNIEVVIDNKGTVKEVISNKVKQSKLF